MIQAIKTLKNNRKYLTKQQYRTLKGQILKGNIEGFNKGLKKLLIKRVV